MIKEITSLKNPIVKYALSLKNNDEMKKERKFLIEGFHLLEMALDYVEIVFTLNKLDLPESITQYIVTEQILDKISSAKSFQKVVAICKFLESNEEELASNYIYLDGVQDPGNVGTILRTALAFNFKNIVLSNDSAFLYNQKVIQSSQGSIFKENIIFDKINMLEILKERGYEIIGTSLTERSINLANFKKIPAKCVLIFGNEGKGMKKEVENMCTTLLKIPMNEIDSLNVGVASGIVMYSFKEKI